MLQIIRVEKVYLETSFFSECVTTRTSDFDIGKRASSNLWWKIHARHFQLYASREVVRELSDPAFANGPRALTMLEGLTLLPATNEVGELAELLVDHRVMPGPALAGDALHVAMAAFHGMDYILTWNVKHLANPNKRRHLARICMRRGLTAPILVTPDLLVRDENEQE